MKKLRLIQLSALIVITGMFSGCATFKSEMVGKYEQPAQKNLNVAPVDVLFIFSHLQQTKGLDAVPKFDRRPVNGFEEIFVDAMTELSNINQYSTFTDYASDVNSSKRRREKDSLMHSHDYIIKIRILSEKSFAKHFFSTIGSVVSATILPMRYKYKYTAKVELLDSERKLIKTYTRQVDLVKWWQTFMLFLYPFKHEERQRELLYVEILHDIFKQIESEGVLSK